MSVEHNLEFVYEEFRMHYPDMDERVINWYPSGQLEITLRTKDGTKYIYDFTSKGIRRIFCPDNDELELTEEQWRFEFALRLGKMMRVFGMNQAILSEESGISQVSLSNYLNCKSTPSSYALHKLARALHCSVSELTYFEY